MLHVHFFFSVTATTEIYTLSLHDALPISRQCACRARLSDAAGHRRSPAGRRRRADGRRGLAPTPSRRPAMAGRVGRSEEHTSELQSRLHLVCRLLLEKKKNITKSTSRFIR